MIKNNLYTINNIPKKYLRKNSSKKTTRVIEKLIKDIINEINNPKKTLNVLNKKFIFNFQQNNLKSFKQFKTIALLGMGGSILGAEAIDNFLENKIKKKIYFFNSLDAEKISKFKKKEDLKKVLFLVISKSGNTIETLSNLFALNIIKKNSKNIIII